MDKEFIPYEQALVLKDLGFDEPCFAFYTPEKQLIIARGDLLQSSIENAPIAPLYQQSFRWLRERFNLDSHIQTYCLNRPKEYHWIIVFNDQAKGHGVAKFYEEAELACLEKLIELIKNK